MNLAYGSMAGSDWPELQHQIAFTLARLCQLPATWRPAELYLEETILPFAAEQAPASPFFDRPLGIFERQVLDALADFGLIEHQDEPKTPAGRARSYRKTSLLDEFLSFDL